jgi:hypothetical protein
VGKQLAKTTKNRVPTGKVIGVFTMAPPSKEEAIVKPPSDKKQYRHVVLPNGLQALLISDPDIGASSHQGQDPGAPTEQESTSSEDAWAGGTVQPAIQQPN